MITLTTILLSLCAMVMALYAFGFISVPSLGPVRIGRLFQWTFYLVAALTVLSVWLGLKEGPSF